MSDSVKVLDQDGFLIQDGNPFPVTAGADSLLDTRLDDLSSKETLSGELTISVLNNILLELKKINLQLNIINDSAVENSDVEG